MSKRMFTALTAAAVLSFAMPVHAEEDELAALARQLLETSGSANLGQQVMQQMVGQMQQAAPPGAVPDDFWTKILERYDAAELTERIVPIYTESLSADEMRAAIDFYSSTHGKTIIEKMPAIMNESMMVSREWGMGIAGEIMQEIQAMEEEAAGAETSEDAEVEVKEEVE